MGRDSVAHIKECLFLFATGDGVLLDEYRARVCNYGKRKLHSWPEQKQVLAAHTVSKFKMHTSLKARTKCPFLSWHFNDLN